jgi:outer membrane immunogenic protein
MKKFLLGSAALVAMLAGPAMAADMPVRAPVLKAPPPIMAAYSWTGCYIGGNVGWAHERDKLSTVVPATSNMNATAIAAITNAGRATISGDGVTGGGQAGCNWQNGSFVLGVEGDINFLDAKASRNTGNVLEPVSGRIVRSIDDVSKDWFATIRGRAGFAFDRVLVYATGGAAIAQFKITKDFAWDFADGCPVVNVLNDCHVGGRNGTQTGWVAGGGVEWALSGNWSIKGEYLHADFGNQSYTTLNRGALFPQTGPVSQPAIHNVKATLDIARAGLNYRF